MFRTDTEIKVGRSLFVDGMTQERAAAIAGVSQGRVSQIRAMLLDCLDITGVNIRNPSDVSQAVGAMLGRAERRRKSA